VLTAYGCAAMADNFTPIDASSREYPNVPLWCRISEAHPSFPPQYIEQYTYEQLHRFVINHVIGRKPITEAVAKKYNTKIKALCNMRKNLCHEIDGTKKRNPSADRIRAKTRNAVHQYLCIYGANQTARLTGIHPYTLVKAARLLGYRYIGASKTGHWEAPSETAGRGAA